MEQLKHFSHHHTLSLVNLQPKRINENSDSEDGDDFVVENCHGGQCKMCKEWIYSFHLCYYNCHDCDYSLHKLCAELPKTHKNHPLHPDHELTLSEGNQIHDTVILYSSGYDSQWLCDICNLVRKRFFNYHCSICKVNVDIICATMSEQKMDHPSHPHQLDRLFGENVSRCYACGNKHEGTFYHCTICPWFRIHMDCALLPTKLAIQEHTNETFTHSHLLTLAYSFPYIEKKAKYFPTCKVCDRGFAPSRWHYKCDKCRYYVHVKCATSKRKPGLGAISKNFKDEDHPNLLHCPFPDESCNLLKHHFLNRENTIIKRKNDEMPNYSIHQHPLILFDTQVSLRNKSISLHDPMKKIQLLCNGCVKPITTVPFYKCSEYVKHCDFVLHEWCAKLPSQVQDHPGHPEHTLVLLTKIPRKFFGVFECVVCRLPSNGFAYGCITCQYYVDINCAFIPEAITHELHPNHLLLRIKGSTRLSKKYCKACRIWMVTEWGFHCPACDLYLHAKCALLLPREIRHKHDKHPLSLRYYPVENHINDYFCSICEDEFDPRRWFYHCTACAESMHAACVPLVLQSEQATYSNYKSCIFKYRNVKFGGTIKIEDHSHTLAFVQGIESNDECNLCCGRLQYEMIFKCLECEFALHYSCHQFVV